eukprot:g26853.t1
MLFDRFIIEHRVRGMYSTETTIRSNSCTGHYEPERTALILEHDPTMAHQAIVSTMDGLRALRFFLQQMPELYPTTTTLLRLAELVLTLNNFSFNSLIYFRSGGFPSTVVDRTLNRVRPISCTSALTFSFSSRNSNRVPLILTYHPTSIHIQKIFKCHFHHL